MPFIVLDKIYSQCQKIGVGIITNFQNVEPAIKSVIATPFTTKIQSG